MPRFFPEEAPIWSKPLTKLAVSAALLNAVKAADTAKILAAKVAYTRTNPPRPCDSFAKSRPAAPVPTPARAWSYDW